MTAATGLRLLDEQDLLVALEEHLVPRLTSIVGRHGEGHCMRCDDIDVVLATRLCRRLRSSTRGEVHVLGQPPTVPEDVAASSTKIVELRNPDAGDTLRPPLLVFVPPGARASAEDSFGVTTFEQLALGPVYDALADELLRALCGPVAEGVEELLAVLREEKWAVASGRARCRYLLTVARHDHDPVAAGAAVCELGLIPDPDLFRMPVTGRVAQNVRTVRKLAESQKSDRQRVLALGLTDVAFRRALAQFATRTGLSDPLAWPRSIVADRENWRFFFTHWPLREDTTYDEVGIEVGELILPIAGESVQDATDLVLRGITGQRYLPIGDSGLKEITIPFQLDRDPRQVAGLARFRVQLMAEVPDAERTSGTATEVSTSVKVSTTARLAYRAKLRKLQQSSLEEGWHYVRVTALDTGQLPIGHRRGDDAERGRPSHESERFYVIPDGEHDGPAPAQRTRRAAGATQAARTCEFDAVADGRSIESVGYRSARWQDPPRGSVSRGVRTIVCDFGPDGLVDVAVSAHLAELQQRILANPTTAGRWHLAVSVTDAANALGTATVEGGGWADRVEAGRREVFLSARAELFEQIARPSGSDTGPPLPIEACDLRTLHPLVTRYVDAYRALLDELHAAAGCRETARPAEALDVLADLARIDTVTVALTDHREITHEIVLVAPTYPARLMWMTAWSLVGHSWAGAATDSASAHAATHALLGLRPLGHPLVVPRSAGRLAVAAFDLTPYWGACLPDGTTDPQGILSLLQTALSVPSRDAVADVWSGTALADRLEHYVRQHPYVRTIVVNAINVGRGEEIAQAVELLGARPGCDAIGFDLRVFVGDPEAPGTAEAIADLLDRDGSAPAISVAVRDRAEFGANAHDDAAHVTVLYDALSAETIGTTVLNRHDLHRPLPVHGLVQDMVITYEDDPEAATVWRKRPRHGVAPELPDAEEVTDLLSTLPAELSSVAATLTTGQFHEYRVPEISLALSTDDSRLLDHAHRCSDWVITVDRTLGIEFFDAPHRDQRPDHVIDYAPETGTALGHHMVVSSRSLDELCALLQPILTDSALTVANRHVRTFFEQLRLLSGRLAFKIASLAPDQRTEVLGLALARLYLQHRGALADQILVPLDAHLDLYREAQRTAEAHGIVADLRRTDLALFDLDPETRTITCRLVEVKCSTADTGVAGYQRLKDRIRAQVERSADVIAAHFDPLGASRPDRAAKNYDLANLLRFYLDRGRRHRVVGDRVVTAARELLDSLDAGFRLEFTRSGLVFDLGGSGPDTEVEAGIEFTRIGRDHIQGLLDAVPTGPLGTATRQSDQGATAEAAVAPPDRERAAFEAAPPSEVSRPGPTPSPRPRRAPPSATSTEPVPTVKVPRPDDTAGPASEAAPATGAPPSGPSHDESRIATSGEQPAASRAPESTTSAGPAPPVDIRPDIVVGTSWTTPQFGIIGETTPNKLIAIDLNETHTVSLFGVQGGGKSYTLGTIIEAATMPAPPMNRLGSPLATIVFHYSATQDYAPEFTSMTAANDDQPAIARLRKRYGVEPAALADVVLLAPRDQCERRRQEYPDLDVRPLVFGSSELQATHWRLLMGAVGNQATYIRQLTRIMRAHRDELRLDTLRAAVEASALADHVKQLALQRLDLASDYIDDASTLGDLVTPGRLIIVDLRDELIEKDEALGLFVVLMQLFADARSEGGRFNKLVVFDEAHKYIDSPDLVKGLVESVREMRHKGMSVLVASQDPPSVPVSLIELSDHIIVHKFTSPAWLKHLQKANAALSTVTADRLAELRPGEAYLWASKSTDVALTERMVKIRTRPRLTRHGGATRTATGE